MSGQRYFNGFGGSASDDPPGSRTDGSENRGSGGSRGRGRGATGGYRSRGNPKWAERNREPRFHDLFGDGRGSRGRGARRDKGRWPGGNNFRGPSEGYGGGRDVMRRGNSGSPFDYRGEGESGARYDREDRRRGLGNWSHYPPRQEERNERQMFSAEKVPAQTTGQLSLAAGLFARRPRPASMNENDENLTSRKKRKHVPGGRIGKYVKTQEYHASLYCDICEIDFFDENAKATHDRSKDHRDNQMRKRKEEDEEAAKISKDPKKEESVEQKSSTWVVSQEGIAAFVKENGANWTSAFRKWANRSIEGAKKTAAVAKDKNIVASVQREILYEFSYHSDNCTMMQQAWGRKPAATGVHYRGAQPSVCKDKVFSEKEMRDMEEERKATQSSQPADGGLSNPEKANLSPPVAHAEPHGYFVRGQPMESERPLGEIRDAAVNVMDIETRTELPQELHSSVEPVDNGGPSAVVEEQDKYSPVNISWKLPRSARYLLLSCKSKRSELVARKQRRVFPLHPESPGEVESGEEFKILMEKFKDLRVQYEGHEYEYASWRKGIDDVLLRFRRRGTRVDSQKQCLHMQIDAAISNEDWAGYVISCNDLVKLHNSHKSWADGDGLYVGYWVLAGLLKSANLAKKKSTMRGGYSPQFSLVTRLRELPRRSMEDIMVHHAVKVLISVISNDYRSFAELQRSPLVTMKAKGMLGYLMDELADVVHERAVVSMAMLSGISDSGVYSNPKNLDLEYVANVLKWPGNSTETRLSEVRSFVEGLPQEIGVDATHSECLMLMASCHPAAIQKSSVVDVETLARAITTRISMDSDEDRNLTHAQSKQYAVLRSDLAAALAAFDRAQDWADLIHDLQRVNRVLNKHSNSAFLPEKALLAKRLSQCLTSFLPSGVHLKALETYHIVFKRIGPARLARDIPLYAGGLFPLFSYCSTSLKGPLLSLYETHFVPLGVALSPILDGFVLAVLPGVEEESSEFYTRSRKLLDKLGDAVRDLGVFARSLWRALLLSPPMRMSAAHYLRLRLSEDQDGFRSEMISDMPLVAYAITAALSDNNALTQRSVLDLLLGELALDSPFFQSTGTEEREAAVAVVGGVFGALIRRDMSLTKRVHAWLLGGNESEDGISFCTKYSNDLVLAAIDREFALLLAGLGGKNAMFATRPCRIAAALMDRAELSKCLGHHFALRVLKYGRAAISKNDHEHERDIRHAISDFLQDLGSARVFAELERMLASEEEKTHEDFDLLSFALSIFPTKNEVVRKKHLPALLRVAVQSLNAVSTDTLTLEKAVAFCSRASQSMGLSRKSQIDESVTADIKAAVSSFASFFVAWLAHIVEPAPVELRRAYDDVTTAEEYTAELRMASVCESRKECVSLAKGACSFFVTAAFSGVGGPETLCSSLQALAKCASAADVRISLAGSRAFAEVSARASQARTERKGSDEQVLGVIRRCWRQMHPSLRTATPQSAQALLGLQRRFPEETKIVIADGILSADLSRRLRNLERFACLWRLAVEHRLMPLPSDNGLFLMLDALTDEDWAPKMLARSWLSDALEVDAASVLDAPLRLLLAVEARTTGRQHEFSTAYDAPRALYGFQVLRGILESCTTIASSNREQEHVLHSSSQFSRRDRKRGRTGMRALAGTPLSARTSEALASVFALDSEAGSSEQRNARSEGILAEEGPVRLRQLLPAHNYIITVALTCIGYLRGRVPERYSAAGRKSENGLEFAETGSSEAMIVTSVEMADDDFEWLMAGLGFKSLSDLHVGVCAAAAECLATLLRAIPIPSQTSSLVSSLLAEPVLTLVKHNVDRGDSVLQLHFLNAIAFLVTADGPCYLSSVQGKEAFTKSDTGRLRLSYSESLNRLPSLKPVDGAGRGVQVGSVETLNNFVPWLLEGVSSIYVSSRKDHDSGSHEVLGIHRRWIQFMETVIRHIGIALPVVTEGLLSILTELLSAQNGKVAADVYSGDSEFSKADEMLVLLEGIAVVTSNVLWSFEYALSTGDLKDDLQSNAPISPGDSGRPQAGPLVNGAFFTVKNGNPSASNEGAHEGIAGIAVSQNGHVGNGFQSEGTNSVTTATASMINAINPLRMINDFVKDVLSGTGSEGAHRVLDPRRSGARVLFCLLPNLLENVAKVWGPVAESSFIDDGVQSRDTGPPRLSTELPRERRQAQRASVVSILEPIFEIRPKDVVASVIALFCIEQDGFGVINDEALTNGASRMACEVLHAIDDASPEVIIASVKRVFEKSVKWDTTSADAKEGKIQALLREKALHVVRTMLQSSIQDISDEDLRAIGRLAPVEMGSSLPGGIEGVELSNGVFQGNTIGTTTGHQDLFHWGDYFAVYSPGRVESACLNFLDVFFATRRHAADLQNSFPSLHGLLKDALSTGKRKSTTPAILRVLGTFVSRCSSPFPERKTRRDVMTLAASVISACSSMASGHVDVASDELGGHKKDLFKRELSVVALRALASTVPGLVDSSFLDDKPQLSGTVTSSLSPAVATLKKAAARASSLHIAAESSKHIRGSVGEQSAKHKAENVLDILASKAATDVVLNLSNRDWGVKFARRELLTLLEDPNFFFGKREGVLEKTSAIVREVVAGGGASALLASIGSSSMNGAPGIPSLFTGRDSETVLRGRAIRRVAFCVFVSEPDFYSPQLPSVLERLRDALRMSDAGLVVECLLCLRALLLRVGPSSIAAFRATTLSEIFRIASHPKDNLNATVAALKFLDLTTLLSPADYGYERCFFFGEESNMEFNSGSELKAFQPLASKLSALWTEGEKTLENTFAPPFRLAGGLTVLPGNPPSSLDLEFVGRYAAALVIRNSMPKMRATPVDNDIVCRELEQEFVR